MSDNLAPMAEEIERVFAILATKQEEYLQLYSELQDAKFERDRAIDAAYAAGGVMGKNEREREANLRHDLASYYDRTDDLERKVRSAELGYKDALVSADCTKLKVMVLTANRL